MIKKYRINYNDLVDVVVELDDDIMTEKNLHEINDFWGGAEDRIEENGSVINAVLKMLSAVLLRLEVSGQYPLLQGIEGAFDWDIDRGIEGWPKMDGSCGLNIITVDELEFDYSDMSISEI